MLPHRLILFHRAQEATLYPIPQPSLKLREHPKSHKPQKTTQQPHLNPPGRQWKSTLRHHITQTSLIIPRSRHHYQPDHLNNGMHRQLSNHMPNLKTCQLLYRNSKIPLNPPTNNHLSRSNRQHHPSQLQKHSWPH